MQLKDASKLMSKNYVDETIDEALIDLYLSVKIRSNEEIDAYNEKVL